MSFKALVRSGTPIMDNSDTTDMMEQWRSDGGFFRHILRNVEPEHVGAMVEMLHRMQESEKPAWVPQGRWAMKMPEGYLLLGEGPAGFDIEPPPGRGREHSLGDVPGVTKLDERDTEGIVALAKGALALKRPDLDTALAQLFALDFARCDAKAVHAVAEAIWVLIAGR
jgi:hypothetical protein